MPTDLDPKRLDEVARRVTERSGRRVPLDALWTDFAAAFPARPQGVAERQWLRCAIDDLAERNLIDLPSDRSRRWEQRFGTALPTSVDRPAHDAPAPDDPWRAFPWHPALAWVPQLQHPSPRQLACLRRVHRGLVDDTFRDPAPLKYRSLQLTGDEKALAALMRTQIFAPGRLTLDLIGAAPDPVPLVWTRIGDGPRAIVFENAGPYAVARRVLRRLGDERPYDVVAYGAGRAFVASIDDLLDECPDAIVDYVGDLDGCGLAIAATAHEAATRRGAAVRPATALHQAMFRAAAVFGHPTGWPTDRTGPTTGLPWLDETVRADAQHCLDASRRIPEEVLGPTELEAAWSAGPKHISHRAPEGPKDP